MKKFFSVMSSSFCLVMVWILMTNSCFAEADEVSQHIEGEISLGKYTMTVDALFENTLPESLMQTKIKQLRPSEKVIKEGLKEVFPDASFKIQKQDAGFDFYVKSKKEDIFSMIDICVPMKFSLSWKHDDRLNELISQCQKVMEVFHLEYDEIPVHATYFKLINHNKVCIMPEELTGAENEYISICLAPSFLSVPLSHEWISELKMSTDDTPEVVSIRMAEFVFDAKGNILHGRVPCFEVVKSMKMPGNAKASWQEIAQISFKRLLTRIDLTATDPDYSVSTYETLKVKDMDELLEKYEMRLTRIRGVWLENWEGGLRPGWCARIEIMDRSSGKLANVGTETYYVPAVYIFGYEASGVSCQSFD